MKVFLVNMDDAKDRLAFMQEQLIRTGVEVERVSAVNGKLLDNDYVKRITSPFLQFCALGRVMGRGEIGCSLSHIGIWKRIVAENISCAAVLEDDVTIMDNIKDQLSRLEKLVKTTENAVYLLSADADDQCDEPRVLSGRGCGHTCGYVVSRAAADFLVRCNMPIVFPCDTWWLWEEWGLKFYKFVPRSVAHWNRKQLGSMNDGEQVRKSIIPHKVKRLFGKPIELIYRYLRKHQMKKVGC